MRLFSKYYDPYLRLTLENGERVSEKEIVILKKLTDKYLNLLIKAYSKKGGTLWKQCEV